MCKEELSSVARKHVQQQVVSPGARIWRDGSVRAAQGFMCGGAEEFYCGKMKECKCDLYLQRPCPSSHHVSSSFWAPLHITQHSALGGNVKPGNQAYG